MAVKRNPTNADIMEILRPLVNDVAEIKKWKEGIQIGQAAVDEFKRQEAADRAEKNKDTILSSLKDLMPYVVAIIVAAATILYAYASRSK